MSEGLQEKNCSESLMCKQTRSVIGCSAWTRQIRSEIGRVAPHDANVLIMGPTGTGKELIAREVHASSDRCSQPFIPVDCAATIGVLFASHVFGHVKGAFTGASHSALGCFRTADKGTIFFDEIGEMELSEQAKLLRVLQERAVVPVGGVTPIPVDVRVIAATNRDLSAEVQAGRFRADLFYRLSVICLRTESLSKRPEDIRPIAMHFLARLAVLHGLSVKPLSDEAWTMLENCNWPGNVRQLQNALEHATLFAEGKIIQPHDFPREVVAAAEFARNEVATVLPLVGIRSDHAVSPSPVEQYAGRIIPSFLWKRAIYECVASRHK